MKNAAFVDRERRDVLAAGGTVLPEEDSRRIFNSGSTLPWNSPWIDLDAPCFEHPERLPWRELLGDFYPPPVLAFTSVGKPVRLTKKDQALDAVQRNGINLGALRAQQDGAGGPKVDEQEFYARPSFRAV